MSKNILKAGGGMMSILVGMLHIFWICSVRQGEKLSHRYLHLSQVIAHALRMSSNSKKIILKWSLSTTLVLLLNVYSKEGPHFAYTLCLNKCWIQLSFFSLFLIIVLHGSLKPLRSKLFFLFPSPKTSLGIYDFTSSHLKVTLMPT